MRHAVWGLLASGCVERGFEVGTVRETCPLSEPLERVAVGAAVLLDWSALSEEETVDSVILGRLDQTPQQLRNRCRDGRADDYIQTELIPVESDVFSLELASELVGPVGTTTRVSLRSFDQVLDSMLVAPSDDSLGTEVFFE